MSLMQWAMGILLVAATFFTSWLSLQNLSASSTSSLNNSKQPDAILYQVEIVRMNSINGNLHDQLFAPMLVHYSQNDSTILTNPTYIVFQASGTPPWYLSAKHGLANSGFNKVQLWESVQFQQGGGPQTKPTTITTTQLTIYPKQEYAETAEPVTAIQPGNVVHAVGMHVNMKTGVVNLLANVNAVYQSSKT